MLLCCLPGPFHPPPVNPPDTTTIAVPNAVPVFGPCCLNTCPNPEITEARIGSLRPRAGVAASASEAAGGEFEGGLEHWSGGPKLHHSVRGRVTPGSAFRCSPGTPPGPLREAPGVLPGARSSALSALFLGALGARRVLFRRRARSSSLSPALARSLSLSHSLSGALCSC